MVHKPKLRLAKSLINGDPTENRTPVSGVRGRLLYQRPMGYLTIFQKYNIPLKLPDQTSEFDFGIREFSLAVVLHFRQSFCFQMEWHGQNR